MKLSTIVSIPIIGCAIWALVDTGPGGLGGAVVALLLGLGILVYGQTRQAEQA